MPRLGVGYGAALPASADRVRPVSLGVRALTRPSLHHFAKWLGRYPDHTMAFCDSTSWVNSETRLNSEVESLGLLWGGYTERSLGVEWVFPLCNITQGLAETTAGTHDGVLLSMFQTIAAYDQRSEVDVRLGWEFNIEAYPWNIVSANTAQEYIDAWRHVVAVARSVSPRLKFTWCPNWAAQDPEPAYPGDEWVDTIGMDCYFKTQFDQTSGQTGAQVWEHKRDAAFGLQWLVDYAAQHRKPWALCEWGGNADEPDWMTGQIGFIRQYRPKYHAYWNQTTPSDADCMLSNGRYPLMGAEYIAALGVPGAVREWDPLLYFGVDVVEWYDASRESSFSLSGAAVARWYPEYGGAKVALQLSGAAQPARSAAARNGLPGVTFDGAGDALVQADVTGLPLGQQAVSYAMQFYGAAGVGAFAYVAGETDAEGGTDQRLIGAGSTGRPLRFQASGSLSTTGLTMVDRDRAVTVSVPVGASPTVSLVAGGNAPQTASVAINAFVPTKSVLGGSGATADGVGAFWAGTIQERVVLNRALTAQETDMLHGYLAHKWRGTRGAVDLPLAHPYYSAPPEL